MNREAIIAGLREEIERLTRVLELFEQDGEATGTPAPRTPTKEQVPSTNSRYGKRSPEVRARMALAQQKRQRARRAAAGKSTAAQ